MKILFVILCLILAFEGSLAQPWSLDDEFLQTYNYEDLSDIIRRFPGMYPLDYGAVGQPMLFRPWGTMPWELRVWKDGIPQNRIGDGLHDSNLQPVAELDSISHDFLNTGAVERINLTTRILPIDSPYSEVQVRESYYGFGDLQLAHGQRLYRSFTFESTARLLWYDGLRYGPRPSSSRFTRLRAKWSWAFPGRWKGSFEYAGSNVECNSIVIDTMQVRSEREEAIFSMEEKDSLQSSLRPSLKLFIRQDRESWDTSFKMREATGGWIASVRAKAMAQQFEFRHMGILSQIDAPGLNGHREMNLGIQLSDSLALKYASLMAIANVSREGSVHADENENTDPLIDAGVRAETTPVQNTALFGGAVYTESIAPIFWVKGDYPLSSRPLLVDRTFSDLTLNYVGGGEKTRGVETQYKTELGVRWARGSGHIRVAWISIMRESDYKTRYSADSLAIGLEYGAHAPSQHGYALSASLPVFESIRIESWWFGQANDADRTELIDSRGFTRLYFKRQFFRSPLTVRSHISHEYIGERFAFSDRGSGYLGPDHLFGFRISGTIEGFTLIYGVENIAIHAYQILPGYWMNGKEEYFALIWKLWL